MHGLPGDDGDDQARWIEATVMGESRSRPALRAIPAQRKPGTRAEIRLQAGMDAAAGGPGADASGGGDACGHGGRLQRHPPAEDAERPEAWETDALFLPQTRAAFRRIVNLGYTEAFRATEQAPGHYSFWDYQAGAWRRNNGIRIDHMLLTPQAADLMTECRIEKEVRGREKPSDHVPVWIELAL